MPAVLSTQAAPPYAPTGRNPKAAKPGPTTADTNVPAAEVSSTALRAVISRRKLNAESPYNYQNWNRLLLHYQLHTKYPNFAFNLQYGFDLGIRPITTTFTPPNTPSTTQYASEFQAILQHEFTAGRYVGPFTQKELEEIIGPFQTSPLSIIPKPGRPGKFRLVQNFSHPHNPTHGISSINSSIQSDTFPCTWGTFTIVCLLIARLPPGSQAAVRDVKEAYRTIPTRPDQWPGMVVRLTNETDSFAVDLRNSFGLASGGGCYGRAADAGTDIMRAWGIGPVSKWVDDHIFFRILRQFREEYNVRRSMWAAEIQKNGGEFHDGGKLWYKGALMPNDHPEEFDEDMSSSILDHSAASPRYEISL